LRASRRKTKDARNEKGAIERPSPSPDIASETPKDGTDKQTAVDGHRKKWALKVKFGDNRPKNAASN
jgi:hypothetical protein